MKILFLHISDTHFRESDQANREINAISKALHQMDSFDNCVIFYTGDVTNSGAYNEFRTAGRFLKNLILKLKEDYVNGYIGVCVIPGNHDMENMKSYFSYEDIICANKEKRISQVYSESQSRLNNFFHFAGRNQCFTYDKSIEYKLLTFDGFKIKVNLVNSAPFSLLKSENKDKGIHYLPTEEIAYKSESRGENFCITMMHHGPEWFSEECKHMLNSSLLAKTDLLMLGHEHYSEGESKIINATHRMNVSRGLALYNSKGETGFNAFVLDTETGSLLGKKFVKNNTYYKPFTIIDIGDIELHKKGRFALKKEFRDELMSDINERDKERIDEYFVFPTLRSKTFDDSHKRGSINDETQFLELMLEKKKISIEGDLKKGKTTLAKHLCKTFADEYVCILLDEKNFAHDANKILKYQLNNQFENLNYDEFEQLDSGKKILIIDNSDKITGVKWNKFYGAIKDKIEYVILLNSTSFNLDIKGKVIDSLMDEDFYELKIEPFYYEKRLELISKICESKPTVLKSNVNEIARKINNEITNQIRFFNLTPDFIHQFVEYFLSAGALFNSTKQENVFNKVYEANIVLRLSAAMDSDFVSEFMVALGFVASNIHFKKKYPFSIDDFTASVEEYNREYDNSLKARDVRDIAIQARIIREVPGETTYEFCDNNLLAYFAACNLHRLLTDGNEDGQEKLNALLSNITDDINGDILLFLSYVTDNVKVLNPIILCLESHMGSWTEFSIDENNISYLSELKDDTPVSVPVKEDKKKHAQKKSEIEKDFKEKKEPSSKELYSPNSRDENEFFIKTAKALKYLELAAKILPGFSHILKGNDKAQLVDILYAYPNKLLYEMLKVIDENHHKLVQEILSDNPKTRQGELITESMIEKALWNQSVGYILTIYDFIASTAATPKTLELFNKYADLENTNQAIQNLLMEENSGEFSKFIKKAETLYDKAEYDVVKRMSALVVRKFYLCHDDVPTINDAQRVLDKMFQTKAKKQFILEQSCRKKTKE